MCIAVGTPIDSQGAENLSISTQRANGELQTSDFILDSEQTINFDDIDVPNFDVEYYSKDDASQFFTEKHCNDLSLIHFNISSLPANFDKLINTLASLDVIPDIISLSETRMTDLVNLEFDPHLENYSFYNIPSKTRSGSVGVFLRNSLRFSIRSDLCASEIGLFETLWFDVLSSSKRNNKFTFGVVYRHPGLSDINCFADYFENTLKKLNQSRTKYFVCGDFNINSMLWDKYPVISSYVDRVFAANARQIIDRPTRFPRGNQHGSPSLIDHLYSNSVEHIDKVGLFVTDISDHLAIIAIFRTSLFRHQQNVNALVRDYSNIDKESFNMSLSNFYETLSPQLRNNDDPDEKFRKLQDHIIKYVDEHARLRERTKREKKFQLKPWITRALQYSITVKEKMYDKIVKRNQTQLKSNYNKYTRKFDRLIFLLNKNTLLIKSTL